MKLILTCGVLLLVTLFASCNATPSEDARAQTVKKAEAAFAARNYREAYALILPLVEKGDADAEFTIGLLALQGVTADNRTLTPSERDSLSWMWIKKAAIGGNEEAIRHIADGYENGWYGVRKSDELAACWRKAIKQRSEIQACLALEKSWGSVRIDEPALSGD